MRRFKLSISLLASGLMAYSPVTMAAINTQQKNQMNSLIKEFQKSSFRDLYNHYGLNLDNTSRGFMEEWLKAYGPSRFESIQVQPFKGSKNQENFRIIMGYKGSTLTMTINQDTPDIIDINGSKFNAWELQNLQTVAYTLSKKDGKYAPLAKALDTTTVKPPEKTGIPKFSKMTLDQKAQYFMMLKMIQESAENVQNAAIAQQASSELQESGRQYAIHPLLQSLLAVAADYVGKSCGVAGYAHEYEVQNKRQLCPAFPQKNSEKYKLVKEYSAFCENTGENTGVKNLVACNPLMFGARIIKEGNSTRAVPYCQNADRADFTQTATKWCNEKAGIPDKLNPNSPESIAKYRQILESLAILKGKEIGDIKACFGPDNRIEGTEKCRSIFEPIFQEHKNYFASVEKSCNPPELKQKTSDQKIFCQEFAKRSLALNYWFQQSPPIATVDLGAENEETSCKAAGGEYIDQGSGYPTCVCTQNGGHHAERKGTEGIDLHTFLKCQAPVVDKSFKSQPEEKCKSEDVGSFVGCHPLLSFGIGVTAFWLISRSLDPRGSTPTTPITPTPPICGFGSGYICGNWWEGSNGKTAPPINSGGGVRGSGTGGTDNK